MTFNLYGDVTDQAKKYKIFKKIQHSRYDNHKPFDPFKLKGATFDTTNIKPQKHFNFNQGFMEEQVDYLHNPYKNEPKIAYFQAKIPPYIANRENRGTTLKYNTMINNLGWN